MITSGHYLHHEYLQPLPTTLDAKQSPLALLAQTCNSIGKDSKNIIPPLDKKDGQKDKDSNKGSPALKTEEKSSSTADKKDAALSPKREPSEDRKTTPRHQHSPSPGEARSHSRHSNGKSGSPTPNSKSSAEGRGGSSPTRSKSSTPSLSLQSNSKISLNCGSVSVEVKHQESLTSSLGKSSAPMTSATQPSYADTIAHGTPLHALPGSYHGLSMLGHLGHGHLDAASAAAAYYASLPQAAAHSAAYAGLAAAASAQKSAAGLSPYLQYTSVKTASGTTLVPVCKDPYCNQCQAAARTAHRASCSPGCTQCTTEKTLNGAVATSLHAPTPLGTGLPGLPASAATQQSLLASLYPHHATSAYPGHSMPVVCNWLQGTEYCGKVFSTSEELLLHLRSHTSLASLGLCDVSSMPSALPYPNLGLTTATAAAAAAHGLQMSYPTQGSRSPNSALRHAYPRSLSPNGLSALAASRYHPYKSPLGSLTQPPSLSAAAGLPAHLSPYYLPYSLYGQRLGAAMTP